MLFIRSLIFTAGMMITVPFFVIPGLLTFPLSMRGRFKFFSLWAKLVLWWLKLICNLRYEVQGLDNIPAGGGIIFCKHQSMWETIALQDMFPAQMWVLKRELLWIPFFGWALSMMGSIGIDRSSGRKAIKQIIDKGTKRLQQGYWIVIFPEGTRVPVGTHKRFGVGGALLAEKSAFPVVPVAHNAGEFWPRRSWIKRPGVIQVVIGEPIDSKGKSAQDINAIAEHWITSKVDEISSVKPADMS